ncbi:DnaA regulatory inactivator Hda [Salinisphaera sp. Q1T1-3]|uniref:DnaA regulatory inactivator Hda n=1 Tax=Salinisphaera sp. Q1T1-3 TaxID=2321229 RepID=UPI00131456DB|nr:DnaA regulatory inactivator Hda [Salinisphaera sp. Q1T1-3]
MSVQLVLGVQLPSSATLDAFVGDVNADAKAAVAEVIAGRSERLYLAGPKASGKTHLLQAACRAIGDNGRRSVYLPLAQLNERLEPLVKGLAEMDCVCIDDIDAIAGHRDAEIALVGLSDALRARGSRLLTAGETLPGELGLALSDLATRLSWGGAVMCRPLDDDDKIALLVERAAQRGMDLPDATARWIVRHGETNVPALMATLDTLDRASLSAHRRLTIPFVKQTLA